MRAGPIYALPVTRKPVQSIPIPTDQAWRALVALLIGFFMILLDTTIVTTALPAIMDSLDADLNEGIWVTSAYLLTYAVPLLVGGRLGDRFGPRNIYLIGLSIFTLASLWCGLSDSAAMLIAARAVQGFGAALLTPQSMSLITRMFSPAKRGAPMALWGATAGVSTLVGPLLGGLLVDAFGWQWIFFVNVPLGVLCFILVAAWVPRLAVHSHSFDLLGVLLSAAGIFLVVFGVQQGESHDWGSIIGPFTAWEFIVAGVVIIGLFVWWQGLNKKEPLLPLRLFRNRNFALANAAITCMGVAVTTLPLPTMLYLQTVLGHTPTQAALIFAPMSLMGIVLAPFTGRLVASTDPKWMAMPGFLIFGAGIALGAWRVMEAAPLWQLIVAAAVMGIGSAFVWPSVSFINNRDLSQADAGAGSGVYNATRQVGAVVGSALIAALMQARITAESTAALSQAPAAVQKQAQAHLDGGAAALRGGTVPQFLHDAFTTAYGQSMLLPAAAAIAGCLLALCFAGRASAKAEAQAEADAASAATQAGAGTGADAAADVPAHDDAAPSASSSPARHAADATDEQPQDPDQDPASSEAPREHGRHAKR